MTKLDYLENTYLFKGKAKIINTWENEFWKYIILDRTIFYPQGWGQPSDTGKITLWENTFDVDNVRLDENWIVFHYWKYNNDEYFTTPENNICGLEIDKETRINNAKWIYIR